MGGGGNDGDGDWAVLPCPPLAEVTLALVGKIGSGKSATANSILGRDAFVSEDSFTAVTETCQKRSRVFPDDCVTRTVNVIDTPGLLDMDTTVEDVKKEMAKCMDMAKDGIHAMLMVISAASRFSCEDEKAITSIKLFFGDKILDHTILVFTHGDMAGGESRWKKKLTASSPRYLQNLVNRCANRVVLFDNTTRDMQFRESQLKKLLDAVDVVTSRNCGRPFCNQMFTKIQQAHQVSISNEDVYDVYLTKISKMVDEKLNSTIVTLQKQIQEEQKTRQEAENNFRDQIRELEEKLNKATADGQKALEENKILKDQLDSNRKCIIL